MTEQKLCKDCKWASSSLTMCCRPDLYYTDLVTGEKQLRKDASCNEQRYGSRMFDTLAMICGTVGHYWEAKDS